MEACLCLSILVTRLSEHTCLYVLSCMSCQWFLKCGPEPAMLASSRNFLEVKILRPYFRSLESETLELDPAISVLNPFK